jgi:hypothetical protein
MLLCQQLTNPSTKSPTHSCDNHDESVHLNTVQARFVSCSCFGSGSPLWLRAMGISLLRRLAEGSQKGSTQPFTHPQLHASYKVYPLRHAKTVSHFMTREASRIRLKNIRYALYLTRIPYQGNSLWDEPLCCLPVVVGEYKLKC